MADETYWTYKPASPTPDLPEAYAAAGWTRDQWESFSPGMRREMARQLNRKGTES